MNRFLSKYPIFSYLIYGFLGAQIAFVAIMQEEYFFAVSVALLFLLIACAVPEGSRLQLMNNAVKKLHEQCDPYPLLQETETQLSYIKSEKKRIEITVNHAMALACIGRHDIAINELVGIGDDRIAKTNTLLRGSYYLMMVECATVLRDIELAEKYYLLAVSVSELQGFKKETEKFKQTLNSAAAEIYLLKNEPRKAEELLYSYKTEKIGSEVEKAFTFGRIYLAQGRRDEAYNCLVFVAQKGNRLFIAEEARRLLAENYK